MKTQHRLSAKSICILLVLCALSAVKAQMEGPEQEAKQILEAFFVKGGLIVHIGCGDGKLTANNRFWCFKTVGETGYFCCFFGLFWQDRGYLQKREGLTVISLLADCLFLSRLLV